MDTRLFGQPGDYSALGGRLRSRAPFALVTVVAWASLLFGGPIHLYALLWASAALAVAVALTSLRPICESHPAQLVGALAYIGFVGLLVEAQGGSGSGASIIALLPVLWISLYGRRREAFVVVPASGAMIVVSALAAGTSASVVVRRAVLWMLVAGAVSIAVHHLRGRFATAIRSRDEALGDSEALAKILRELTEVRRPSEVFELATSFAVDLVRDRTAGEALSSFLLISDDTIVVAGQTDSGGRHLSGPWPLSSHPLVARVAATLTPVTAPYGPATMGPPLDEFIEASGLSHGAWIPVMCNGALQGILALGVRQGPISPRVMALLVSLGHVVELALANASEHNELAALAHVDPLTGLANRRGVAALAADTSAFAVITTDLDGLKEINDVFGHAAGDRALKHFAQILRAVSEPGHIAGRLGGDEFIVVIPSATSSEARRVAERILDKLAANDEDQPLRASIGFATTDGRDSFDEVLWYADSAMYNAKRAGGMRIAQWDQEGVPAEI